jgi:hypothetical protein
MDRAFVLSGLKAASAFIGVLFVFDVAQVATLAMSGPVGLPAIVMLFLSLWVVFSGTALMVHHERSRPQKADAQALRPQSDGSFGVH